jgi:sulfoxide reductase heme-binding subunit YedZ
MALKALVFAAAAWPGASLIYNTFWGDLGVNPLETLLLTTGETALVILLCSLAVTPVRRLSGWNRIQSVRRMLGLWAFFYAFCHLALYLLLDRACISWADCRPQEIVDDVLKRKFIFAGMLAFLAMVPLALTSTKGWIRRLGRRWQSLHRLAYLAGAAGVVHFLWKTKVPEVRPYTYAAVFVALMLVRAFFAWQKRARAAIAVLLLSGVATACGGASNTPWLSNDPVGGEPSSFVVLAGNWTVAAPEADAAGSRLLRLDGSTWKTGTTPANLSSKAMALYPRAAESFGVRVLGGLQFAYGVQRSVDHFADGEIQVEFRLIGGASDQFAGILFGLNVDGDHYAYRYNTKDGDTALWRVVNGERQRIHHGGVHLTVPMGEWRTLRMRVKGAEITGWVDDVQTLQFMLPDAPSGKVGLWSKPDAVTDYRNFVVR